MAADPSNDDARFDYVRLLIASGGAEEAAQLCWQEPLKRIPQPQRFAALKELAAVHSSLPTPMPAQWPLEQFDAAIAHNKRDFGTRFAKAQLLWPPPVTGRSAWTSCWKSSCATKPGTDQAARKLFVAVLELLAPAKPKQTPCPARAPALSW